MVKCHTPDCNRQKRYAPTFGLPPRLCSNHAPPEWVDVIAARCTFYGCLKRPSYGYFGGPSLRCTTHATDEMVDTKHKRCGFEGCMTIPSFGLVGGKAVRCVSHAPLGMVDVKNKPKQKRASPADGLHLLHDVAFVSP